MLIAPRTRTLIAWQASTDWRFASVDDVAQCELKQCRPVRACGRACMRCFTCVHRTASSACTPPQPRPSMIICCRMPPRSLPPPWPLRCITSVHARAVPVAITCHRHVSSPPQHCGTVWRSGVMAACRGHTPVAAALCPGRHRPLPRTRLYHALLPRHVRVRRWTAASRWLPRGWTCFWCERFGLMRGSTATAELRLQHIRHRYGHTSA